MKVQDGWVLTEILCNFVTDIIMTGYGLAICASGVSGASSCEGVSAEVLLAVLTVSFSVSGVDSCVGSFMSFSIIRVCV